MFAPALATLLAAPPVVLSAWWLFRYLTRAPGRHRLDIATDQYRPHLAAAISPAVEAPAPDGRVAVPCQRPLSEPMKALVADLAP
jgi:hypothetical protein